MLVEWKSLSDYSLQSFLYSLYIYFIYTFSRAYIRTFRYIGYILVIFRIKV